MNNIYNFLKDKVDFYFDTPVSNIEIFGDDKGYIINTEKKVTSVKNVLFQLVEVEVNGWKSLQ